MPDSNLIRLTKKNLLYAIRAAVGSQLFRHIYVRDQTGREFDALDDGDLSCAYFVSGLLALHGLIDRPHATVQTTLKQMEAAGWRPADAPLPGGVVLWPEDADGHTHLGFCLDDQTYMSNTSFKHTPALHAKRLADGRTPSAYFVHPQLV